MSAFSNSVLSEDDPAPVTIFRGEGRSPFFLTCEHAEVTFYNVAAVPTLPTIAWGALRHGIEPALIALATIVNVLVFILLFIIYMLIRRGTLRFGLPED